MLENSVLAEPVIYVNGRFMTQPLSGVQRFALEISQALARISRADGQPAPIMLTPAAPCEQAMAEDQPRRAVGRRKGQMWEQFELPRAARQGVLLNLGNTGPLWGGPRIVIIHDAGVFSQPGSYSWKFRLWYRFLHTVLRYTHARLVTVSRFSRMELAKYLRIPAERITVISEGAEHIAGVAADPAILARFGLHPQRFVLAVGNLAPHKNLARLDALARALGARGIPLVISGSVNAAVFNAKAGQALPNPAIYVGRVTDRELRALYEAAACFVFPSLYEGFGLPPLEAMACGCPVVAADIAVLHEICGTAALYADPTDPDAIAKAVLDVLDTPSSARDMRAAGKVRAASFTWDRAARSLLDVARSLTP
ncbi:glycosyltransferase family 4 protein [Acetobacter sp. TBRC 12305]|uniref:Glycosyltransferase family 4 protein n=1 Tax=Acetobacter garciniae TaxID=2817435 RepID=A0A939HKG8_9PROT|nr:glycosyltransferase family 1 protein [Acetobacter garciniae]MBO1325142.1 glycosyltransferase family 4 protein [Acetobacter garciniae]MBX0344887.1 glycosyltransferase family 4 protein [Acetobacter garciniae]